MMRALHFLILLGVLAAGPVASKDAIKVDAHTDRLDIHQNVLFQIDSQKRFNPESAHLITTDHLRFERFVPAYYKGGNLWATFFIVSASDATQEYILEVGGYGEVKVFFREKNTQQFTMKQTGRYVPYPENELARKRFRNNKVSIILEPGNSYEFVLFYPDPGTDKIKPEFIVSSAEKWEWNFLIQKNHDVLLLGLFFGVSIVLAIINFFYYFIHRELAYIHYTMYIVTMVYFEASRYGLVDATPLIGFPVVYFLLENTFLIFSVVFYLLFLKSFLNTRVRYPFWSKVANVIIGVLIVGLSITLYLMAVPKLPLTGIEVRNYFMLATLPLAGFFFVVLAMKGNAIDKIFLLGSVVLISSGLISILLDLFVKSNLYPDLIFQIGVIIEITIFSVGLGVKSRYNEREKQIAQAGLINQLKENERLQLSINQELEKQVNERTYEIQAQNEELITQQEELAAHRDMLESQNKIISESMEQMQLIKMQLEDLVEQRTMELKNANSELLQRNNQLEQYAYITAHNLRGPVARLKGLVYIFDKTGGLNDENRDVAKRIVHSVLEMDEVLTDMNTILELKNQHFGKTDEVDINLVLEKVYKILKENLDEANTKINETIEQKHFYGNAPFFESILYNLLSNAIKYRSEKKDLIINIKSYNDKLGVGLAFSDNGIGIDLERHKSKIFGLYQRFHDHVPGKGLGLYLVKTQVEAMGGDIKVESEPGQGTTFTIVFPK